MGELKDEEKKEWVICIYPGICFYKEATLSSTVAISHTFYHSAPFIYNSKLFGFQEAHLYQASFS